MKIISRFKDFYDFEIVKYGIDEKLIFNRKTSEYCHEPSQNYEVKKDSTGRNHLILLIGDKTFYLFKNENRIYTHFDLMDSENIIQKYLIWKNKNYWQTFYLDLKNGIKIPLITEFGALFNEMLSANRDKMLHYFSNCMGYYRGKTLVLNEKISGQFLNEPIVLIEYLHTIIDFDTRKCHKIFKFKYNPNLSQMGIYIDPDIVWQSLVEFLSRKRSEKEIMPEIPNDIKIEEHGFDLKTSFRPKMKKKK